MLPIMRGTCGAMRGAWAMIVASMFTIAKLEPRELLRHVAQELAAVDARVARGRCPG